MKKEATTELLILGDGKILVHNLSPAMAELLAQLDPDNFDMRQRAAEAPRAQVSLRADTTQQP